MLVVLELVAVAVVDVPVLECHDDAAAVVVVGVVALRVVVD